VGTTPILGPMCNFYGHTNIYQVHIFYCPNHIKLNFIRIYFFNIVVASQLSVMAAIYL